MERILGKKLKQIRLGAKGVQKTWAFDLGIAASKLSDIENGKLMPTVDELARISHSYGLEYREAVRMWLLDQSQYRTTHDLVAHALGEKHTLDNTGHQITELLTSLADDRGVEKAAKTVLQTLDASKAEILRALGSLHKLRGFGGRVVRTIDQTEEEEWKPLGIGRMQKLHVWSASRPTRCLFELHRIPSNHAAVHRQAHLPQTPPYYEVWCATAGSGILLVEEDEVWRDFVVSVGRAGCYWGGHRHVWINPREKPLIIFHAFFPYRPIDFNKDAPGEARGFDIEPLPDDLPPDVFREVRRVLQQH